jgi:general secretion pathway protein D
MVSVDENTNSLVITATPFQYARVEELLNRLDLLPRQVLVEVTVGEVTLNGSFQFGIEWAIRNNKGGFSQLFSTLATTTASGLSLGTSGFLYTIASGNFQAALQAFAKDDVLKVLSTPRLVVLDNEEANIEVGTEVPILTSQATATGVQQEGTTSLLQSIQYVKTGVIMTVKPTINSQGMLTLLIKQEVSDPATNTTSDISSPSISTRKIDTTVALKSGSSIMLGGLIQNQTEDTVYKIPWLGDIPLIAPLFKNTQRTKLRTELFVVITPHILTSPEDAEEATKKYRELMPYFH